MPEDAKRGRRAESSKGQEPARVPLEEREPLPRPQAPPREPARARRREREPLPQPRDPLPTPGGERWRQEPAPPQARRPESTERNRGEGRETARTLGRILQYKELAERVDNQRARQDEARASGVSSLPKGSNPYVDPEAACDVEAEGSPCAERGSTAEPDAGRTGAGTQQVASAGVVDRSPAEEAARMAALRARAVRVGAPGGAGPRGEEGTPIDPEAVARYLRETAQRGDAATQQSGLRARLHQHAAGSLPPSERRRDDRRCGELSREEARVQLEELVSTWG